MAEAAPAVTLCARLLALSCADDACLVSSGIRAARVLLEQQDGWGSDEDLTAACVLLSLLEERAMALHTRLSENAHDAVVAI